MTEFFKIKVKVTICLGNSFNLYFKISIKGKNCHVFFFFFYTINVTRRYQIFFNLQLFYKKLNV